MPWKPGESGNPKGRPKGSRILTDILSKAGDKKFSYYEDGTKVTIKYSEFIAEKVMEALATGKVTFFPAEDVDIAVPTIIDLDSGDWLRLLQFFFTRIEGLAPKGQPLEQDIVDSGVSAEDMEVIRDKRWDVISAQLGEVLQDDGSIDTETEGD